MSAAAPADTSPYITTTKGGAGWFAVCMWWNTERPDLGGFWEPWQSGSGRYRTEEEADTEGRGWAEAEGLKFYKSTEGPA